MPILDIGATLAFGAEPEVLNETHDGNREGVIGHEDVDLGGRDARVAKGNGARLGAGTDGNIGVIGPILGGFPRADDPDWLLAGITGHLGGSNDERATAVRDHTALE